MAIFSAASESPTVITTTATMKALRFHNRRDIRIDTVPVPPLGPGLVRLTPKFCGICGSDLHEYLDGPILTQRAGRPHPISGECAPLTMGHEFSGIVDEVGAVDGAATKSSSSSSSSSSSPPPPSSLPQLLAPGDAVCVFPLMYDGDCGPCARGLVNCCDSRGVVGVSGWGGGLSGSVVVPASCVRKLPAGVPLEVGALVEPLAVGWHAVATAPAACTAALVLGAGPIGLAVVQALSANGGGSGGGGCGCIIVSEPSAGRRAAALRFGAHCVIDPACEDVRARVADMTQGNMADVAFDAAGVAGAIGHTLDSLKVRGTLVNIAVWAESPSVPMNKMSFREIRYTGVSTYTAEDFDRVIEAIADGRMAPASMITKRIRLDRVVEDGFEALARDKETQIKIMVNME